MLSHLDDAEAGGWTPRRCSADNRSTVSPPPSRQADDRLVASVARLCARARDPLDLLEEVAGRLRRRIPYAAAGWLLVDPDTLLINGVYAEGVDRETHLRLIAAELSENDDVNRFVDLARAGVAAESLSAATSGELGRSARWRELYGPQGYGDELRAVFAEGPAVWGQACLTRTAGDPWFTAAEVDLVRRVAPHLAHGIRTGLVVSGGAEAAAPGDEPGLVVLRDDGTVDSATPSATDWFGDLEDPSLRTVIVLHEVAERARSLARAGGPGPPARAWARAVDGGAVLVRGTRLDDGHTGHGDRPGRTALVLEPARRSDVAPVLMQLHALTHREREVTQLLLTGRATRDIAADLWITPETLRGHVKSILAKLEVSSRAELFAMLSHEPRSRLRPAEPAAPRSR